MSTSEIIQTYVAAGYGIGLSITAPGIMLGSEFKVVELADFPKVKIATFWQRPLPLLPQAFLDQLREEADQKYSVIRILCSTEEIRCVKITPGQVNLLRSNLFRNRNIKYISVSEREAHKSVHRTGSMSRNFMILHEISGLGCTCHDSSNCCY